MDIWQSLGVSAAKDPITGATRSGFDTSASYNHLKTVDADKIKKYSGADCNFGIMIVDMQPCFLKHLDDDEFYFQKNAQQDVLEQCAQYDIPVCFVEYVSGGGTIQDINQYGKKALRNMRSVKCKMGAFTNPTLEQKLKSWDITDILLMGVNASGCVKETAIGALQAGFDVWTADQLIADGGVWKKYKKSRHFWDKYANFFDDYRNLLDPITKKG